jgi:hypothetical protein
MHVFSRFWVSLGVSGHFYSFGPVGQSTPVEKWSVNGVYRRFDAYTYCVAAVGMAAAAMAGEDADVY